MFSQDEKRFFFPCSVLFTVFEIKINCKNVVRPCLETGMMAMEFFGRGQPDEIVSKNIRIPPLARNIEESYFLENEVEIPVVNSVEAARNNQGISFERMHPETIPHAMNRESRIYCFNYLVEIGHFAMVSAAS